MKTLYTLLIAGMLLICTSCTSTYAVTADDVYDNEVSVTTVVTYGTPYYVDGVLVYYYYNNLYYYPYYYRNVLYYRPFYRPLPPRHHYYFGRPKPNDVIHYGRRPGSTIRPRDNYRYGTQPSHRPNLGNSNNYRNPGISNNNSRQHRPNVGGTRPSMNNNMRGTVRPNISRNSGTMSRPSVSRGMSSGNRRH